MYPHRYARYVAADNGETWDTWHYEDESPEFVDLDGRAWRRVAVTKRAYYSDELARAELDEADEPFRPSAAEDSYNRGGW